MSRGPPNKVVPLSLDVFNKTPLRLNVGGVVAAVHQFCTLYSQRVCNPRGLDLQLYTEPVNLARV